MITMGMWDKLFWAWFSLGGFAVAYTIYANPSFSTTTGLLVGVSIIATGIVKLTDEVAFRELKKTNTEIVDALHWIKEGLSKIGSNGKIEDDEQHTILTKKILELENRMNRVSKALTAEIVDMKSKQGDAEFVEIKEEQKQE
ncbi:MAG: hypothetical protein HY516_01325 [Candidatus Aenigmarchaeota archaeon]|nr:hypothetical protein [Candidatus Aenigmarchaeota archaeon]